MSRCVQEVGGQLGRWFEAIKAGDPDQVTRLYADDATLLATLEGDVKQGQDRIRDYFARAFLPKRPEGAAVEPSTIVMGDVAVNSGIYAFEIDADGGRKRIEARYTFVYKRLGDDWVIVQHHSSARPDAHA